MSFLPTDRTDHTDLLVGAYYWADAANESRLPGELRVRVYDRAMKAWTSATLDAWCTSHLRTRRH